MIAFGISLLFLCSILTLAYFRVSAWIWSLLGMGTFAALWQMNYLGITGYSVFALFTLFALVLNLPFLRRLITKKVFNWFRLQLPRMSNTEKEAIDAGDVWWEQQLFQGRPNWAELGHFPKATLSTQEQHFIDNQVEVLCSMLNDWEITHELGDLPPHVWDYIKSEKFFGFIIPKEYGGLDFSPYANSSIVTKIATRSISAAVTVMVPNSLGPAELLHHYGTAKQKDYYLPRLATGLEIPCFALTSPEAGSDAGAIPDVGIVCHGEYQGQSTLGIKLTFDKRYITLAPKATIVSLVVKLYDPERLLSEQTDRGVTVCLVHLDHPGVEAGQRHFPLNQAFMNGPIRGKDVFIPLDWIIGGQDNIGKGWRMIMECLSAGRGISLPALSAAMGQLTYKTTSAYSAIRKQFNCRLYEFEGVEESMANIAGKTYLLQSMRDFVSSALGQGVRPAVATAISKYHMTELSRDIINDAMDIHGGRGIMMGPANYLARAYQSVPVSITVEGANILTRSLIIFGQGMIRCHPYVLEEFRSAELYATSPKEAVKRFDRAFMKHIGYFISNTARCFVTGLTRGILTKPYLNDVSARWVKKVNWLSSGLAFSSDVAVMLLGQALKRKEKLSARFGDVLSYLYMASAVVKFYADHGRTNESWPLAQWCLQHCLYQAQEAFYGIFANFPSKAIGKLLQVMIFPFGRSFSVPDDALGAQCSQLMHRDLDLRAKLTELCYIGESDEGAVALIEFTFQKMLAAQEGMNKLNKAIKEKRVDKSLSLTEQAQYAFESQLISSLELQLILEYEVLRRKAIAVDEFIPEYGLGNKQCIKQPRNQQVG